MLEALEVERSQGEGDAVKTPRQIAREVTASVPSHFDDVTNAARAGMIEALDEAIHSANDDGWVSVETLKSLKAKVAP